MYAPFSCCTFYLVVSLFLNGYYCHYYHLFLEIFKKTKISLWSGCGQVPHIHSNYSGDMSRTQLETSCYNLN